MQDAYPRTIQIFLPSGDPTGIRIAEQTSSIVRIIEVPRSELEQFFNMDESKQPGIYFLISGDNKENVYIGQSTELSSRLKEHHRSNKNDWEKALVLVSLTNNLTSTHVLYLESSAIKQAKECQRYNIINNNNGQKTYTPIPLKADCDEINRIASLLLTTLGYPIFDNLTDESKDGVINFNLKRNNVDAKARYTNEGMVVLKGSNAPMETNRKIDLNIFKIRDVLFEKGVLEERNGRSYFTRDYLFNTPSGASSLLCLGSSNGWTDWKNDEGVPLTDVYSRD